VSDLNGRPLASLGLALLWSAVAIAIATATGAPPGAGRAPWGPAASVASIARASAPAKGPSDLGGGLDTGQFLPDTTVLLRVGDRVTRIRDFVDDYFGSYAEFRPPPDSAGRVEFLQSLINKEVLGLTALGIDRPLGLEDRTLLRADTERVLANVLYQRAVRDSVTVTEENVNQAYAQYRRQSPPAPPALASVRSALREQLRRQREGQRADRLRAQVAARIGMVYDTTNIVWSAPRFRGFETFRPDSAGATVNPSGDLPAFAAADTARVLARHRDGRFTLGDFLRAYQALSPIMRPPVGDFEAFRAQLDAMALAPYMVELARARGLERDSMTVAEILRKREEILVGHLFEDSVRSKVSVPSAERRRYYDQHIAQYVTYPRVRFAAIVRPTRSAADSLLARLAAGANAADILHADSLAGMVTGSIREMREDERGSYHDVLFGELRPGQGTVAGPDWEGTFMVLQSLDFDPGHQLPYEDVVQNVDESLRNIHAEAALRALIARHAKRYRIEAHPELLMRIRLTEPGSN
jgi:hypothetical protein